MGLTMHFYTVCIIAIISAYPLVSKTISVYPKSGKPLTNAIHNAHAGDTILLHAGTYSEGLITITKPITIIGQQNPVLDGDNKSEILLIRSDSVTISGLTLRNTGISYLYERAGIRLEFSHYCIIENNIFENTCYAIYSGKSSHNIISHNSIRGNSTLDEASAGNGIHCWYCNNYRIEYNTIEKQRDGIYLEFTTESQMTSNRSEKNLRYGLHFMFSHHDKYEKNIFRNNGAGVAVMYTHHVEMYQNIFEDNQGSAAYGLLLKDITDGTIKDNTFSHNTAGIYAEGGGRIIVEYNDFIENGWAIRLMADCTDNTFSKNNFLGNTFDIATNSFSNYSVFTGNYWDKYTGYDINKDSVGDIPYHPVRLFCYLVEQNPPAMLLLRSFLISLLEVAESIFPSVTPDTLIDNSPAMVSIA